MANNQVLLDTFGLDCCCGTEILLECPTFAEMSECQQSASISITGVRVRIQLNEFDFCELEHSFQITQLDLTQFANTAAYAAVPFPQGGGCVHYGTATSTVVDQGGNLSCEPSSGALCAGSCVGDCWNNPIAGFAAAVVCRDAAPGQLSTGVFQWSTDIQIAGSGQAGALRYGRHQGS